MAASTDQLDSTPNERTADARRYRRGASRLTLPRKAMLGALGIVMVSVGLCGYLTARIAVSALRQSVDRDARLLTETLGRAVADSLSDNQATGSVISEIVLDQRIAFVMVADAQQNTVARRISEPVAWRAYRDQYGERADNTGSLLNRSHRIVLDTGQEIVIYIQPIWEKQQATTHGPRQIRGYLTLALNENMTGQTVTHLRLATIAIVFAIGLLCLPLVVIAVRNWARPLRRLVLETRRLASGQQVRLVGLNRGDEIGDLTRAYDHMAEELSLARDELIQANVELEQKVIARTAELDRTNQKLQQQMQEKDDFIRAIMHDLNAPLRNIAGMTRMLLMKYEQSLSEDAVNKLQRIAANAKQETELLADLLELSRLRAQPGKTERTDLNALLTSLAEALDYELEQKAITLNIGPLPTVLGDRNRLRQVFQNLLENAIKYMPADAPQRRIDVGCQQRDGAVHFYVKDTGPGIAPEDQQRIFQVFQRARYSGSTDADGRGVGLSTVKAIVETMGGKLWVQSTVGRGATFYFTFSDLVTEPSATPAPVETVGQAATD